MPNSEESFIGRWSRRKQQVEQEQPQHDPKIADEASGELPGEAFNPQDFAAENELSPEEKSVKLHSLTDEDMPDLETLDEHSDYSGFMSNNVSEGLRKLALQKLFHGKSYNFRDGLDEYDDDFTSFEKLDPETITADMKHMIDVEAKRMLAKEQEEERPAILAESDSESDVTEAPKSDANHNDDFAESELRAEQSTSTEDVAEASQVQDELVQNQAKNEKGIA